MILRSWSVNQSARLFTALLSFSLNSSQAGERRTVSLTFTLTEFNQHHPSNVWKQQGGLKCYFLGKQQQCSATLDMQIRIDMGTSPCLEMAKKALVTSYPAGFCHKKINRDGYCGRMEGTHRHTWMQRAVCDTKEVPTLFSNARCSGGHRYSMYLRWMKAAGWGWRVGPGARQTTGPLPKWPQLCPGGSDHLSHYGSLMQQLMHNWHTVPPWAHASSVSPPPLSFACWPGGLLNTYQSPPSHTHKFSSRVVYRFIYAISSWTHRSNASVPVWLNTVKWERRDMHIWCGEMQGLSHVLQTLCLIINSELTKTFQVRQIPPHSFF